MPLYEYRCLTCRSVFEVLRPMRRAAKPEPCPAGHERTERVVSLVAARPRGGDGASLAETAGGCACGSGGCGCRR